jgi:hypothetical protein
MDGDDSLSGKINAPREHETQKSKFQKMYITDPDIVKRNKEILNSRILKNFIENAKTQKSSLYILDQIIPIFKLPLGIRFRRALNPFYKKIEYESKDDYLQYLKKVYVFLISPLEEPPPWLLRTYRSRQIETWAPSLATSRKLLRQFYLEVELINDMSEQNWEKVRRSSNPESALFKQIYGIKFAPEFETFLSALPWRVSHEPYGAPGLDLSFWRTPGPELPKKPLAAELDYITRLVKSSKNKETYTELYLENKDKYHELTSSDQVISEITRTGKAMIDSYVGISKRETDFVLHQRVIIWENPSFKKYQSSTLKNKFKLVKPTQFLAILHERVIPLEIPFLSTMEFQESDALQIRQEPLDHPKPGVLRKVRKKV